jgi:hypothetical protein
MADAANSYVFTIAGEAGEVTVEELAAAMTTALNTALRTVPAGGTTGHVLTKTSGGYAWQAAT